MPNRNTTLFALVVLLLAVAPFFVEGQVQTYFSVPRDGQPDYTLEQKLTTLIDSAVPNSSILVAIYHFTRVNMAEALIRAHERGVHVYLIIDRSDGSNSKNPAVNLLKSHLEPFQLIVPGKSACIGNGIQHNKFFLFSRLQDGSHYVVAQSSANLTQSQLYKHNNMVVVSGDEKFYQAYNQYWRDLKAQQQNLDYYHSVVGDHAKAYFFPRKNGDTIISVLDNAVGNNGSIHIAMSKWTEKRSYIVDKLAQLQSKGWKIEVVINANQSTLVQLLKSKGIPCTAYDNSQKMRIHSKYMLIEGYYGSEKTWQRLVWTGSSNFTKPGLSYNDETMVKLYEDASYHAFLKDWHEIRDLAISLHRDRQ